MADEKCSRGKKETFRDTIARDSTEQAMLVKQDEIINLLKALTAKMDADGGISDTETSPFEPLDKSRRFHCRKHGLKSSLLSGSAKSVYQHF